MIWECLLAMGAILVVGGLGALASVQIDRTAAAQALLRADLAVDTAAQHSLRTLETAADLMSQARLADRLRNGGEGQAAMTVDAALRQSLTAVPAIVAIELRGADGALRWSSQPLPPEILAAPGFARQAGDPMQLRTDPVGGRSGVRLGRVYTDPAGAVRCTVVAWLDPQVLSAQLAALPFGEQASSLLVALPGGAVVADSTAAPGFLDSRPALGGAALDRLSSASGHVRAPAPLLGRDSFMAFRRLLTPAVTVDQVPLAGLPVAADVGPLAVVVALDAAQELAGAWRQDRMIAVAVAAFALLCLFGLLLRLMLLRRRRGRALLSAAWRQVGAVKAVRAELEQLLAGLPVAAYQCRVGADGSYARRYVSPMLSRMTGWPMHALATADQWENKLEEGPHGRLARFFASVLHDGEGAIDYRMRRPDGGWVWLRERARIAARVPDGGGGEVIGTISDVTAEGELSLQAAMTSKLSVLGEMASGIAHELNQPVTVIGLAADQASAALAGGDGGPAVARHLATIADQAERSAEIIDQLRLFGRGDAAPAGPVRLDQALRGAMILAEGPLREAAVALHLDVPDWLPPVFGRLVQVEQVLVNLCMNARDALLSRPPEERALSITAEAQDDQIRLRVADTGGGIAAAMMNRLFDPFVTGKPGHGSGLGLSICQRLMRGCDGEIAARNDGKGAVFTLTFRRAAVTQQSEAMPRLAGPAG